MPAVGGLDSGQVSSYAPDAAVSGIHGNVVTRQPVTRFIEPSTPGGVTTNSDNLTSAGVMVNAVMQPTVSQPANAASDY